MMLRGKALGSRDIRRVRERLGLPQGGHLPDLTPIRLRALHARDAGVRLRSFTATSASAVVRLRAP